MPIPAAVERYRKSRAIAGPWQLAGEGRRDFHGAVVIPALAEESTLFATLGSLQANPPAARERFLTVVVVNHPIGTNAPTCRENLRTLQRLREFRDLALAWVDAASPGFELPAGGGVGLARKIGFDLALACLDWREEPLLVSLDADTLVRPDYFSALLAHFQQARCGGAVLPFCHQPGESADHEEAIVLYELYLRSYALGLALAGSPYGFPAIGSALACRAAAYVRSGGMNRRTAGEDFYFLQQLVKTTGVARLSGTMVYPSARTSRRTPFGTGPSILRLLLGDGSAVAFYPADAFRLLGDWLALTLEKWQQPAATIAAAARSLHPHLGDLLQRAGFATVWPRLQCQHRNPQAFTAAFDCWFDGLKTRQFLHSLAAAAFPPQPPAVAVPPLLAWGGMPPVTEPAEQLSLLRGCARDCVCPKSCNIVK